MTERLRQPNPCQNVNHPRANAPVGHCPPVDKRGVARPVQVDSTTLRISLPFRTTASLMPWQATPRSSASSISTWGMEFGRSFLCHLESSGSQSNTRTSHTR